MDKVILTKEQIVAIEDIKKRRDVKSILDLHNCGGKWSGAWEPLNGIEYEKLALALNYGYQTKEDYIQELEKNADGSNDNVTRPDHYHTGNVDVIEFSKENFAKEESKGFYRISAIKYITRYDKKNGIEDLEKAIDFINRLKELESTE